MHSTNGDQTIRKEKSEEEVDLLKRSMKKIKRRHEVFEGGTTRLRQYDDLVLEPQSKNMANQEGCSCKNIFIREGNNGTKDIESEDMETLEGNDIVDFEAYYSKSENENNEGI